MKSLGSNLRTLRSRFGLSSRIQSAAIPPSNTYTNPTSPPIWQRWGEFTEKSNDIIAVPRLYVHAAIYGFYTGGLIPFLEGSEED